jgi:hypothetical protein
LHLSRLTYCFEIANESGNRVCSTIKDHSQQLSTLSSRYVSGRVLDSIGSGSRKKGKNDPQKEDKKLIILFFEVLDVRFCGLKASPVALTSFKEVNGKVH